MKFFFAATAVSAIHLNMEKGKDAGKMLQTWSGVHTEDALEDCIKYTGMSSEACAEGNKKFFCDGNYEGCADPVWADVDAFICANGGSYQGLQC